MMKENMESMQAVTQVAKALGKAGKNVGIAGNKDKRGITTQLVSVSYGNLQTFK
jgi:tRNA(Glu) U13 pseudouridine synthase TruD